MLAAVAFGCAQAGWSLVAPGPALGSVDRGAEDGHEFASGTHAEAEVGALVSPFAPHEAAMGAASNVAAAYVSTIQLAGVRLADNPDLSGAIVTLQDGGQRAFRVGQELSSGVVLAEVTAGGVRLAFEGGERLLTLPEPAAGASFADALLGRVNLTIVEPAPAQTTGTAPAVVSGPPSPFEVVSTPAPTIAVAPSTFSRTADETTAAPSDQPAVSPGAREFLARIGVVRVADGFALGQTPTPAAFALGLRAGDVIVAVNGVAVHDLATVAPATPGPMVLTVRRGAETMVVDLPMMRAPA